MNDIWIEFNGKLVNVKYMNTIIQKSNTVKIYTYAPPYEKRIYIMEKFETDQDAKNRYTELKHKLCR